MSEDHKEIYLEPLFIPLVEGEVNWYDSEGRQWCQDDVWDSADYDSVNATKYVRADLYEQLEARIKELNVVVEQVAHIGVDFGFGEFELGQEHIDAARKLLESES